MEIPFKLKEEILKVLDQSDLGRERSHAENTLFWVLKIKPEASLALQIAALGHDIERGIQPRFQDKDFPTHQEYKKAHSEKGAQILCEILIRHKFEPSIVSEVGELVRLHEVGGTEDSDVLMDADSISFFDNNLESYIGYKGLEGAKKQVEYKFQRGSARARGYIASLKAYKSFAATISNV